LAGRGAEVNRYYDYMWYSFA